MGRVEEDHSEEIQEEQLSVSGLNATDKLPMHEMPLIYVFLYFFIQHHLLHIHVCVCICKIIIKMFW